MKKKNKKAKIMIIETLHNEQRTMREEETSRYVHHPARRYTRSEMQLGPKETIIKYIAAAAF